MLIQGGALAACSVKPPLEHLHFPYGRTLKVLCSLLVLISPHEANQGTAMPKHVHPIKGTADHTPIRTVSCVTLHP